MGAKMAAETSVEKVVVNINGKDFDASCISEKAKEQLYNLQFVNEQILQKNNELQIADSARIIYNSVLKSEISTVRS